MKKLSFIKIFKTTVSNWDQLYVFEKYKIYVSWTRKYFSDLLIRSIIRKISQRGGIERNPKLRE